MRLVSLVVFWTWLTMAALVLAAIIWILAVAGFSGSRLCLLVLWSCVLILAANRHPYLVSTRLSGLDRPLRAVGLAAVGVGLAVSGRGPELWALLGGLGAMLLMLRWRWKH